MSSSSSSRLLSSRARHSSLATSGTSTDEGDFRYICCWFAGWLCHKRHVEASFEEGAWKPACSRAVKMPTVSSNGQANSPVRARALPSRRWLEIKMLLLVAGFLCLVVAAAAEGIEMIESLPSAMWAAQYGDQLGPGRVEQADVAHAVMLERHHLCSAWTQRRRLVARLALPRMTRLGLQGLAVRCLPKAQKDSWPGQYRDVIRYQHCLWRQLSSKSSWMRHHLLARKLFGGRSQVEVCHFCPFASVLAGHLSVSL